MARHVDLSDRLFVRAEAQDRLVFCLNGATIPMPGIGKFAALAAVMFAACGVPSISAPELD